MSMWSIFNNLLENLPLAAVATIGLAYALIHKDRIPRPALAILIGRGIILATILVRPIASSMAFQVFGRMLQGKPEQMTFVFRFLHFVFGAFEAGGIGAIMYAAFLDRGLPLPGSSNQPQRPW